jgi:hypothetical protein
LESAARFAKYGEERTCEQILWNQSESVFSGMSRGETQMLMAAIVRARKTLDPASSLESAARSAKYREERTCEQILWNQSATVCMGLNMKSMWMPAIVRAQKTLLPSSSLESAATFAKYRGERTCEQILWNHRAELLPERLS